MSSTASKLKNISHQMFVYVSILLLLFLTLQNVNTFLSSDKVLSAQTEELNLSENNTSFWNGFLERNPNYVPGWNEIGRTDRVKQIDPNFRLDTSY